MWIYSYESSLNPNHAHTKHKNFFYYIVILENQSFSIIWPSHPSSQSISYTSSFKPYLSHHKIIRNSKCWTNPFQLFALLDLVCLGTVCLCCVTPIAVDWNERTCIVERSKRVWTSKRQVTHILTPIFYYMH
jgi:hypothetical protein